MKRTFRIIFICLLLPFLANAQKIQTDKRIYHNDMDGQDYTEISSFYFDKNDNKIMHGQTITTCNVNNVYDAKNSFKKNYKEVKNYSHGTLEGPYSISDVVETKNELTVNFRTKICEKLYEHYEQGTYKNGKKEGLWIFKNREKAWNSFADGELSISKRIIFKDGKEVGAEDVDGKYNILLSDSIKTSPLLANDQHKVMTGRYEQFDIKNNLVTNFILRGGEVDKADEKSLSVINKLLEKPTSNSETSSINSMKKYIYEKMYASINDVDKRKYHYAYSNKEIVGYKTKDLLENILDNGLTSLGLEKKDYIKQSEEKKEEISTTILYNYFSSIEKLENAGYKLVKETAIIDINYGEVSNSEYDYFILSKIPVSTCEDVSNYIDEMLDDLYHNNVDGFISSLSTSMKKDLAELVTYAQVEDIIKNKSFNGYGKNGSFNKKITASEIEKLKSKYADIVNRIQPMILFSDIDYLRSELKEKTEHYEKMNITKYHQEEISDINKQLNNKIKAAKSKGFDYTHIQTLEDLILLQKTIDGQKQLNNKSDSIEILTFSNIMSKLPNLEKYYNDIFGLLFEGWNRVDENILKRFFTCYGNHACLPMSLRENFFPENKLPYYFREHVVVDMEEELGVDFNLLMGTYQKYFKDAKGYTSLPLGDKLPNDIRISYQEQIPELFTRPLNNYQELVEYNNNYDSVSKYLNKVYQSVESFCSQRNTVYDNTAKINNYKGRFSDIVDGYQSYLSQIDVSKLSWKQDKTTDDLQPILKIQNEVLDFIAERQKISDADVRINKEGSLFTDVISNYKAFLAQADLSWKHGETKDKLQSIINTQDDVLGFIAERQKISENDAKINSEGGSFDNVISNYKAFMAQADLSWKAGETKGKLLSIIGQQEKCLSFVSGRKQISEFDNEIMSLGKKTKNIVKIYSEYLNNQDLSWKPNEDIEKINPVITSQQKLINGLKLENIADIDKTVKKQKVTTLDEVLKLF